MAVAERRTREEQRAATRRRLVDAAVRVIREQGFHATSLDQIAAAAGVTKGAIYSNFESKDELVLEVAEHVSPRFDTREDESFRGMLDALGSYIATLEGAETDRVLLTLEFSLYAMRNQPLLDRMRAQYRQSAEEEALELQAKLAVDDDSAPVPIEQYGVVLNSVVLGLVFHRLLYGEDVVTEDLCRWLLGRIAPE